MMVRDVYTKYQTPPWLQVHQLRAAAAGKLVAEAYKGTVDVKKVVTGCLFHDLGSIVKFDFENPNNLQGLYPTEGISEWIAVREEFRKRYDPDEHRATDAILAEIGGLDDIRAIVARTGFARMKEAVAENNIEVLIVQYADMRTGPFGILSLEERIRDVQVRYAEKLKASGRFEAFDDYLVTALEIEGILFGGASISPEDINDVSVGPLMEELKKYEIS